MKYEPVEITLKFYQWFGLKILGYVYYVSSLRGTYNRLENAATSVSRITITH